jgi:gamma-glutamyltranspeptidase/glutathione hydrolase
MHATSKKGREIGLGAVAAGHPATAQAAVDILEEGGNAVDAAIAAIWTSTIAEAPLTGIGAGGFATIRTARGEFLSVDFFVDMPGKGLELSMDQRTRGFHPVDIDFGRKIQRFYIGGGAVGVPGLPAGVEHLHRRFGSLSMERLVAPACRVAREGIQVTQALSDMVRILGKITCAVDEGKRFYCPNGTMPLGGDMLFAPAAARFMEDFARRGAEPFYRGDVAERLIAAVSEGGGFLTGEDLASYRVVERPPEQAHLSDITLHMAPPPGIGGALIAFSLSLLDGQLKSLDSHGMIQLAAALTATDAFRRDLVNPLMNTAYPGGLHSDPSVLRSYQNMYEHLRENPGELAVSVPSSANGSTTHLSVLAADGSACSVTTSNGEGSNIWIEDLGIHINNMVGEEDLHPCEFHGYPSGVRLASMMAPTIAVSKDGRTVALGSGGSNRLRSAILQVLLHHLGGGMELEKATSHPRMHMERGVLDVEPGFAPQVLDALVSAGLVVNRWPESNLYFGGVHAAAQDETGRFFAAGDPRRGGIARVL